MLVQQQQQQNVIWHGSVGSSSYGQLLVSSCQPSCHMVALKLFVLNSQACSDVFWPGQHSEEGMQLAWQQHLRGFGTERTFILVPGPAQQPMARAVVS